MKLSNLGWLAAVVLAVGCTADMRGATTPPLVGDTWVQPSTGTTSTLGDLTLVEFFSPT